MVSGPVSLPLLSRAFCLLGLLALLGVLTVASAPVIYNFNYQSFNSSDPLQTVNCEPKNGTILLTKNSLSSAQFGAVWYTNKVHVDSFNSTFTLFMANNTVAQNGIRDGIAFVIQNAPSGVNSLVSGIAAMGYGSVGSGPLGLPNSLAIEFDTHYDKDLGDPEVDHISIHSRGVEPNSANESFNLIKPATDIRPLRGSPIQFQVIYSNKTLEIFFLPNGGASLTIEYDLVEQLGLKQDGGNGLAYIGFAASCGDNHCQNQQVLNWDFNYLGVTTAAESTASGPGLTGGTAGALATFTIQAVDQFGYNVTRGGDTFDVNIQAAANHSMFPQQTQVNITDNKDGTYLVTYNVTLSAPYEIAVTYQGVSIKQSPFKMTIVPGPASAKTSDAIGNGLVGPVTAGDVRDITIYAKDVFGNNVTESTDDVFTVTVSDAAGVVSSQPAKSEGKGVYGSSYNLTQAQEYNVSITLQGEGNIVGSPYPTITVVPAEPFAPLCSASGTGVQGGYVGVMQYFNITVKDRYNNLITTGLPPNFEFQVVLTSSDNTVNGQIFTYNGPNGTIYVGAYNVTVSGQYAMKVTLNNAAIAKSPFTISILPDNSAWGPKCIAYGLGASSGVAGVTESFVIQARDIFGNNMTEDNQVFTVGFLRNDGKQPNIKTTVKKSPLGQGRYDVFWTTTAAYGGYLVNVTLLGLPIANGTIPCKVLPSSAYPSLCTAQGSALTSAKKDKGATFTIVTRDQYSNLLITGGLNVSVVLRDGSNGKTVYGNINDFKNGTYAVTYTLTDSGHYMMTVQIEGGNIADSPFFIEIPEDGIDTMIFVYIGLGVGGALVIVLLIGAFFLYRRWRTRHSYQSFGL